MRRGTSLSVYGPPEDLHDLGVLHLVGEVEGGEPQGVLGQQIRPRLHQHLNNLTKM